MPKFFDNVKVGDQLELPNKKAFFKSGGGPEDVAAVMIVSHRWLDPYEGKEYVGLSPLQVGGGYEQKPTEKWTITGLARQGYRYAKRDWIQLATAYKEAREEGKVVGIGALKEKERQRRLNKLKLFGPIILG